MLVALSFAGLLGPPGGPEAWEDHQVKGPGQQGTTQAVGVFAL